MKADKMQKTNLFWGVDYYPEHWPKERYEIDAKLMQDMGIKMARLGEFSWHKMEPKEGKYDFDWLEDAIKVLAKYGIKTILGTPSAAPPAWMINKHPEILPVDRDNVIRGFGGRHHDCQSNPIYRDYCKKLVKAMAKRFGDNKNVIGWQIDNEFGNAHGDLCTCDSCRKSFQKWLKKKYQNVENLNKAWGTAFWSQEINDFSEVFTPKKTVTGENPSQMLDWKRFCSDLVLEFGDNQINIIRKYAKNQFITHNYMGFADKVNYYELANRLDFVCHDQYTMNHFAEKPKSSPAEMASQLDVVRSYKNAPYWIMEQQSGICGWETLGRTPAPGQLTLWAMQSVAHGGDAISFFRWRSCLMGTEQYWHGIIPHSGNPGRVYAELQKMTKEATPVMELIQGSMPTSEVGIVYSFDQKYAFQIQPHNPELAFEKQVKKYHEAFYKANIPVDFVPEDGDFNKYKLLVAPLQYLMNKEKEDKFFAYVKQGGHLVLTMRTGVKDDTNICMSGLDLPGRLAALAGAKVLDYDCLNEATVQVSYAGKEYVGEMWSDILTPEDGTEVLATYASNFYKGSPAITRSTYGDGYCYYIGMEPSKEFIQLLCEQMAQDAKVEAVAKKVDDVEFCVRDKENMRYLFVLNHSDEEREIEIEAAYQQLMGEKTNVLKPYAVHVYCKNR